MDLYQLSRTILLLGKAPINKVRFARIIYFVHKELIRKKFMSPEDIAYIRSPLGPVPEGFMRLALEHPSIITNPAADHPSFAAEEYAINPTAAEETDETLMLEQYREVLKTIERTLKALSGYSTPDLVEASHADPSWNTHFNGARFFITPADLKNPFPFATIRVKIRIKRPTSNELGALQANLLRGMIKDIVKESTDLEYPNQPSTSQPPMPNQQTRNQKATPKPANQPAKPKSAPKLNPLELISTLPFLKHTKSAPKTRKPSTELPSEGANPSRTAPAPEQNPNKTPEGTK